MSTATDRILAARAAVDPAAPLVTHYDVDAGTRVELSAVSAGNWAAKIAGYLRDDLGVAAGDEWLLDLPAHWLSPAVLLGVWWTGARAATTSTPATTASPEAPAATGGAGIAGVVTDLERVDAHGDAPELLVMSTDPMGRDVAATGGELPLGVVDLVADCRIQPDAFVPGAVVDPGDVVLDGATFEELATAGDPGRVLVVADGRDDVVAVCARVLAAGGSLVLVTGTGAGAADDDGGDPALDRIAADEKTTARA